MLPDDVIDRYRTATDLEIRCASFGLLTQAEFAAGADWQTQGSFSDQRVFGPVRDFACACGKYAGSQYANIICDRCGVKVTMAHVRRRRCGHMNFHEAIAHPLGDGNDLLSSLPVLPVAFVESASGPDLLRAYDAILRSPGAIERSKSFGQLLESLLPVLLVAHRWDLRDRLSR